MPTVAEMRALAQETVTQLISKLMPAILKCIRKSAREGATESVVACGGPDWASATHTIMLGKSADWTFYPLTGQSDTYHADKDILISTLKERLPDYAVYYRSGDMVVDWKK